MKVLMTGHDGYIGSVLVPVFEESGNQVTGLDTHLYGGCDFGDGRAHPNSVVADIRNVDPGVLEGFDAVVHLAAISNDPLGDLNPDATLDINWRATISLARAAKEAGVGRFLFSSSCSLYGAHGDDFIDESAGFNPVTPYGESKVLSERDLLALADDSFSPTFLRNATAYGVSRRLRGDLVVNNLTGFAVTTGQVFLKSDGTSWRPLIHVEDIARAFLALMSADRDLVHCEAFNIGATSENYQIKDVADIVAEVVPGSTVTLSDEAFHDLRNYRVDCGKFAAAFPDAQPKWTVRKGVEELYAAFQTHGITLKDLEGSRFMRIRRIRELMDEGLMNSELRWVKNP
ncbi:MAG: SDR family oxidoreductase [Acidimicrobiia bacterium]|nr:SDR family oxidoreductase [Acidimicrobiia bacterium]